MNRAGGYARVLVSFQVISLEMNLLSPTKGFGFSVSLENIKMLSGFCSPVWGFLWFPVSVTGNRFGNGMVTTPSSQWL